MANNLNEIIQLRHKLHSIPETAHNENKTADCIIQYLESCHPDKLVTNIGGHGIGAVYNGKVNGPSVMLRCELDGLPIPESSDLDYRSQHLNNGHMCGHDGHMAIICGMAKHLSSNRPNSGRVILLFQPAEETGEGAQKVLNDSQFKEIEPDYMFALHNLPGYNRGEIILREGIFASASIGVIIKMKGKPSHASHPKDGLNPSLAVSQIVQSLYMIPQMNTGFSNAALITPIHIRVGSPAFGTSAGDGEVMATLRTHREEEMEILITNLEKQSKKIADAHGLKTEISYTEEFKAVHNSKECTEIIRKSAEKCGYSILKAEQPFPWSEDFGLFTTKYKGALFGLGSGKNHPQLHNNDYDFPDELIGKGVKMFRSVVEELN